MSNSHSIHQDNSSEFEKAMLNLNVQKTDRILFIGSGNLSLCLHLCNSGYEKLYLIDKERNVYNNPYYTSIRYFYQKDFKLHFPLHFFKVILVSESDFDQNLYNFAKGGGAIIESGFDTTGERSKEGVTFDRSSQNTSKDSNFYTGTEGPEKSSFRVFKVNNPETEYSLPRKLDIICYSGKEEGIYIHSKILKERLEAEYGILVNLTDTVESVQSSLVIFEYHASSKDSDKFFEDIMLLLNRHDTVILENHGSLKQFSGLLKILIDKGLIVTYRSPEIAEQDHIERYSILPVLSYKNIAIQKPVKIDEIKIGTFGFIGKQKGTEDIISLALKLKVHAELLVGVNPIDPDAEKKINAFKRKYGKRKKISINIYNKQYSNHENDLVNVSIGNHADKDIIDAMSSCSHIAFAHRTRMEESGTIKYAKRLSKPIFALDSYQARIGQVRRFSKFTNLTPFRIIKDTVTEGVLSFFRGQLRFGKLVTVIASIFVRQIKVVLYGESPNTKNLKEMQTFVMRDDDGLDYLIAIISQQT